MKPLLAIVGRPNVGKSALFNRLCGKQIALVYDRPGVTRDRLSMECTWDGRPFTMVDTGGVGLDDQSGFEEAIQREVSIALETATDVMLVVDGRDGITPLDEDISRRLRRASSDKRIILVVNKLDTAKQADWEQEFRRLGFGEVYGVSAAHGRGIQEMMEGVSKAWPRRKEQEEESPVTRIAVVGRPNVGKSSFLNALTEEDRLIVSPTAGTTRDAIDIDFEWNNRRYEFVDTAGMRKRTRLDDALEQAMTSRSAHTINRAHICVLVIDASAGVTVQEKKIAGLIQDSEKPCIILINKWDLSRDADLDEGQSPKEFKKKYEEAVRREFFFLNHAPMVFVSAKEKVNIKVFLKNLEEVAAARLKQVPTGTLNRMLKEASQKHFAPIKQGKALKIYYASQQREGVGTPTINIFINKRALWSKDYQRYLEQCLRKSYPWTGCPIRWIVKDKAVQNES